MADTFQRLGSDLGSTFVDGGVHPRFGTRNFTMPVQNGQYLKVACPLDGGRSTTQTDEIAPNLDSKSKMSFRWAYGLIL